MKRISLAIIAVLMVAGCGGQTTRHTAKASAPAQAAMGSVHPPGWGATPPGFSAPRLGLPSTTRTGEMLDGIFVSDFHGLTPFAVAGYTAGFWPDWSGLHAAFPNAHSVSIAISVRWHADCLDVEPQDATPAQAGSWVLADIKAGFPRPCVYSDLSEMPAVKANLAATLGPNWRARVFLWLAWYRFTPGLVAGYDAVQWTDHALGRNLDESTVATSFLQFAHPPYGPKPTPKPKPRRWASAEIQLQTVNGSCAARVTKGRWAVSNGCRVRSLPFDANPLGGR